MADRYTLPTLVLGATEIPPLAYQCAYAFDAAYLAVYRGLTQDEADFVRSGFTLGRWPQRTWDGQLLEGQG